MSSPPGPKICSNAFRSNFSAALISASTACCGVSKLWLPTVEAETVADGLSVSDCCAAKGVAKREAHTTVQASEISFAKCLVALVEFMSLPLPICYLRRPPPPRLKPPPPPRERMLEEPRLLLERALDPL